MTRRESPLIRRLPYVWVFDEGVYRNPQYERQKRTFDIATKNNRSIFNFNISHSREHYQDQEPYFWINDPLVDDDHVKHAPRGWLEEQMRYWTYKPYLDMLYWYCNKHSHFCQTMSRGPTGIDYMTALDRSKKLRRKIKQCRGRYAIYLMDENLSAEDIEKRILKLKGARCGTQNSQ